MNKNLELFPGLGYLYQHSKTMSVSLVWWTLYSCRLDPIHLRSNPIHPCLVSVNINWGNHAVILMCITPLHGSRFVLDPLESQKRREVVVTDRREYQLSLARQVPQRGHYKYVRQEDTDLFRLGSKDGFYQLALGGCNLEVLNNSPKYGWERWRSPLLSLSHSRK